MILVPLSVPAVMSPWLESSGLTARQITEICVKKMYYVCTPEPTSTMADNYLKRAATKQHTTISFQAYSY